MKQLILVLCFLLPLTSYAAIAEDSHCDSVAESGTCAVTATAGMAYLVYQTNASPFGAVTFGGVACTHINTQEVAAVADYLQSYYCYWTSSGNKTIANMSDLLGNARVIGLTGVALTNPVDQQTHNANVSTLSLTGNLATDWCVASWNRSGANVNLTTGPITFVAGSAGGHGLGDSKGSCAGNQTQNWDSSLLTGLEFISFKAASAGSTVMWPEDF